MLEARTHVSRLIPVPLNRRKEPSEATPGVQLLVGTVPTARGAAAGNPLTAVKLTFATPDRSALVGAAVTAAKAVAEEVTAAADAQMKQEPETEAYHRADETLCNVRAAVADAQAEVTEAKAELARALAAGGAGVPGRGAGGRAVPG